MHPRYLGMTHRFLFCAIAIFIDLHNPGASLKTGKFRLQGKLHELIQWHNIFEPNKIEEG